MYRLEEENFKLIHTAGDPDDWGELLPYGKIQEMQLAFAMISHPRLGRSALGKILGTDTIKLIIDAIL